VNPSNRSGIDNPRATVSTLRIDGQCTLLLLENSGTFGSSIRTPKNLYDVGIGSVRKNNGRTSLKREEISHMPIGLVFARSSNIKGNAYRLISKIYYPNKTVLVRAVLTHAEYDKRIWKNDCEC
jgi:hypothetical protein